MGRDRNTSLPAGVLYSTERSGQGYQGQGRNLIAGAIVFPIVGQMEV